MINVIKEVERSIGYAPAVNQNGEEVQILEGQPVMLTDDGMYIKPYDGSAGKFPLGFACESNVPFPLQGKPFTAGYGFDYSRINRGGLISFFFGGGMFEISPDGKELPFVDTDTYVVNGPLYVNSNGKLTSNSNNGTNPQVGIVLGFTASGGKVSSLKFKALI
ncbi:MAG: hypothetical protein QXL51_00315 [Candidatus Aenigmatarchaeota archaeon]